MGDLLDTMAAARALACPTCGAEPGQACIGTVSKHSTHRSRHNAGEAALVESRRARWAAQAKTSTTPRLNDVFTYRPDGGQHHCREGVAIALTDYDGSVALIDTFWQTRLDDLAHRLTETEQATIQLLGNLDDYRDITAHAQREYAVADRLTVPSQHEKANKYYVRVGANPDRATILENAERVVAKAEQDLRAAERHLEDTRAELERLRRA